MLEPEYFLNKIGKPQVKGKCSSCGKNIQKLLKAEDAPADLKAKMAKHKKGGSHSGKKSGRKSGGRRSGKKSAGRAKK